MAGTLMKQSEITLAHDPFASDSQPELLHAEVESGLTQTAPTPPPHTHKSKTVILPRVRSP